MHGTEVLCTQCVSSGLTRDGFWFMVTLAPLQVRLTLIARVSDGLPLAEGLDKDEDPEMRQYDYKNQAKVRPRIWTRFEA
jgi:hypothetical protein